MGIAAVMLATLVSLAILARPAAAQTRRPSPPATRRPPGPPPRIDRGYVVGGLGLQLTPTTFSDVVNPIDFGEAAIVDNRFRFATAANVDVGGVYHAWRRRHVSIGLQLSHLTRTGTDTVSAQVPHPFLFNRLRSVSGEAKLGRQETGFHVRAIWTRPIRRRWQAALGIGPSWIHVGQDVVQDVTVTQTYPYDTATFATAVFQRRSGTGVGFNVGGAADYEATRRVGIRISLDASRARVPLTVSDTHSIKVTAGGVRLGAGLLFRF